MLANARVLSYISPSNYLTSGDSIELRKILLNNQIIEIIDYEESDAVFESVTQAVATIVLVKSNQNDYFFYYKKLNSVYTIEKSDVLTSNKYLIKGTNSIIRKLCSIKSNMAQFVDGWQGEINVSTKKEYFIQKQKKDYLPLVRGKQIGSFKQIKHSDEFCPITISTRKHYNQERIVIQEIANSGLSQRLKGVIMKNVLCGHTTNYLIPKQDSGVSLKYLLALINSKLLNYYFKFYNQTNHVPIGEIKDLPLIIADKFTQIKFEIISDYLMYLGTESIEMVNPYTDNESIFPLFEDVLNMMVYELYFGDHMKEIEIDVLKFIDIETVFKPIVDIKDSTTKAKIIGNVLDWLQKKENPIRNRIILSNIRSPEIIKIINAVGGNTYGN